AFLDEAAEVPPLPDELARTVERYQDITRDQLEVGRKLGMKKDELLDFDTNYTARRKVMTVDADGNLRTPVFSGADESSIAREGILRGRMTEDSPPLLVGGTATIMRLGKDEIINEM